MKQQLVGLATVTTFPLFLGCATSAPAPSAAPSNASTTVQVPTAAGGTNAQMSNVKPCDALAARTKQVRADAESRARNAYSTPERVAELRAKQTLQLKQDEAAAIRFAKMAEHARATHQDGHFFDVEALSRRQAADADRTALAEPPETVLDVPAYVPLPPFVGTCRETADGAWGATLEALDLVDPKDPDEGSFQPTGLWALTHVSRDGTSVRFVPRFALPSDPVETGPVTNNVPRDVAGGDSREPTWPMTSAFTTFDYDGDGHPELVAAFSHKILSMNGDQTNAWGQVLTVKDGAVVPYAAAKQIIVSDVQDVDGDGRPDLVSISQTYEDAPDDCESECVGSWIDDPSEVWRSLPDGTFARVPTAPKLPATKTKKK